MSDDAAGAAGWPRVSVVMPVRNEAAHLEGAVASILAQDYPGEFDVCVAVAPSDDGTEALAAALAEREPRLTVVANPAGVTPAGLNAAIAATSGDVVVRVDGHAALPRGYIRRAVETMQRTGAVNVGGMQVPAPETPFEEAVARATTSWLGTGGARYRVGGDEGIVDTVYLGVFERSAGDAVGWYDEGLVRNQDYELNIRLRAAGGVVWFDPDLRVSYRPRSTLRALARQYYEYGWWKAEVVRRTPTSLRLRQAVPALLPVLLIASVVLAARRPRYLSPVLAYALVTLATGAASRPRGRSTSVAGFFALPAMHLAWGAGFWGGVLGRR